MITQIYWLFWKDILLEIRRRESVMAMFFFGVSLLFLFYFAFEIPSDEVSRMAPGLLWLAFMFTGTLVLTHLFQADRDGACLEALLLAPMDRGAYYLAKVLFNVALMVLLELVVLPLFAVLFNLDLWHLLPALMLFVFLGTVGFCVVGVLFAGVTLKARARELLLPLLLFPLVIPVLLATVRSMEIILRSGTLQELLPWLRLLIGFDVIFLVLGFLLFEYVVDG